MPIKWNPTNPDDIVQRFDNGDSVKAIAAHYGISRQCIARTLTENGRTPRNRSEAMFTRMAQTTPEGRCALTASAHVALRTNGQPHHGRVTRAIGVQRSLSKVGHGEIELMGMLQRRGLDPVHQLAFDIYNIDIAILPVAVELLTNAGSPMRRAPDIRKVKDLTNAGVHVIYVWVTPGHSLSEDAADDVVAFYDVAKSDPSPIGRHRVIRGSGQLVTAGRGEFNHLPRKPAAIDALNING